MCKVISDLQSDGKDYDSFGKLSVHVCTITSKRARGGIFIYGYDCVSTLPGQIQGRLKDVVWVEPIITSKASRLHPFMHQSKVSPEGLQGRHS